MNTILTATLTGAALGVLANILTLVISIILVAQDESYTPFRLRHLKWDVIASHAAIAAIAGGYVGLVIGVGIWVFG